MKPKLKSAICLNRNDLLSGSRSREPVPNPKSQITRRRGGLTRDWHRSIPGLHLPLLGAVFLALGAHVSAAPMGTAFTYQGYLLEGTNAVTGLYDFRFWIYDAGGTATHIAGPLDNSPVGVTNGYFTTTPDFGAGVFLGDARWLEAAVRTNGTAAFHTLAPRVALTPTPYALYTPNAGDAAHLNGQSPAAFAPATGSPAYVSKTGDTMTGSLVVPANGLRAGTDQPVLTGDKIGIGTDNPLQRLDVGGDALVRGITPAGAHGPTARLMLGDEYHDVRSQFGFGLRLGVEANSNALAIDDLTANVGIGTTTPAAVLDIFGTRNTGPWIDGIVNIGNSANYHLTLDGIQLQAKQGPTNSTLWLNNWGGDVSLGSQIFVSYGTGVGIGTTTPQAKLEVAGTVRAQAVESASNQPLDFYVNGQRAVRLECGPNPEVFEYLAPNLIGGGSNNVVGAGVAGATIAGGGGWWVVLPHFFGGHVESD